MWLFILFSILSRTCLTVTFSLWGCEVCQGGALGEEYTGKPVNRNAQLFCLCRTDWAKDGDRAMRSAVSLIAGSERHNRQLHAACSEWAPRSWSCPQLGGLLKYFHWNWLWTEEFCFQLKELVMKCMLFAEKNLNVSLKPSKPTLLAKPKTFSFCFLMQSQNCPWEFIYFYFYWFSSKMSVGGGSPLAIAPFCCDMLMDAFNWIPNLCLWKYSTRCISCPAPGQRWKG